MKLGLGCLSDWRLMIYKGKGCGEILYVYIVTFILAICYFVSSGMSVLKVVHRIAESPNASQGPIQPRSQEYFAFHLASMRGITLSPITCFPICDFFG